MTTSIMIVMKFMMILLIMMMMKHLPGNDTVNHCSPISDHEQPSVNTNVNININISTNLNIEDGDVHGCIFDDVKNEELGFCLGIAVDYLELGKSSAM